MAGALAAATLTMAVAFGAPALADTPDPSVHQIYEAAQAGHYDQAQQMMDQVLRDHPKSAKAHYVQAELYARQGKTALARSELTQAEEFDPGLPHENPRSVQELKSQLGMGGATRTTTQNVRPYNTTVPVAARFPWGTALLLVLVVGALWMMFRRRRPYASYPVGGTPGMGGGGPGYGPGPGYGGAPMGGGMGSGIGGGLASGLAVGAGVVAGEELAHHFLDGGNREGSAIPPADAANWQQPSSNSDMGGSDFGVNDGGSWDDSSGGGGGGGDDWS